MARSIARQAAMQLLYERLSGGEADNESLELVYEQLSKLSEEEGELHPSKSELAYIKDVLEGVKEYETELDDSIEKHSTGAWTLERVPRVDLTIMRLAAWEILHESDVPGSVAISEAVELANRYSDPDSSSRFINGVLGTILREKEAAE